MREIHQQRTKLQETGEWEWGVLNFERTQYQHPQNRQWYQKFDMTEDALQQNATLDARTGWEGG